MRVTGRVTQCVSIFAGCNKEIIMEIYISYLAAALAVIAILCVLSAPNHRDEIDELLSKVNRLNARLDEMPAPKKRDSKGRFKSDK